MRLYIYMLAALLLGAGCGQMNTLGGNAAPSETPLRFDGLYYKEGLITPNSDRQTNYTYLRFYQDGTVLFYSSASTPDQISKWMTKKRIIGDGKTKFKVTEDNTVNFTAKAGTNYLLHDGIIKQDTLEFNIYGSANQGNYISRYTFIKLDLQEE